MNETEHRYPSSGERPISTWADEPVSEIFISTRTKRVQCTLRSVLLLLMLLLLLLISVNNLRFDLHEIQQAVSLATPTCKFQ